MVKEYLSGDESLQRGSACGGFQLATIGEQLDRVRANAGCQKQVWKNHRPCSEWRRSALEAQLVDGGMTTGHGDAKTTIAVAGVLPELEHFRAEQRSEADFPS
jgi:hypothetical protein